MTKRLCGALAASLLLACGAPDEDSSADDVDEELKLACPHYVPGSDGVTVIEGEWFHTKNAQRIASATYSFRVVAEPTASGGQVISPLSGDRPPFRDDGVTFDSSRGLVVNYRLASAAVGARRLCVRARAPDAQSAAFFARSLSGDVWSAFKAPVTSEYQWLCATLAVTGEDTLQLGMGASGVLIDKAVLGPPSLPTPSGEGPAIAGPCNGGGAPGPVQPPPTEDSTCPECYDGTPDEARAVVRTPANGWEGPNPYPRFFWAPADGAYAYEFQLSETPDFSAPVVSDTIELSRYVVSRPLAPGEYFWRTRSRMSPKAASDFSPTYRLRVVPYARTVDVPEGAGEGALRSALSGPGPVLVRLAPSAVYRVAAPLILGGDDQALDGRGARLVSTNPRESIIRMNGSRRAVLRDLTLDYQPNTHSIGRVTAVGDASIDVVILDGYPLPTDAHIAQAPQNYGYLVDPARPGRLVPGGHRVIDYRPVTPLGAARAFRLTTGPRGRVARQGDHFVMYGRTNGSSAIHIGGTEFATLDRVTVEAAPAGMVAGSAEHFAMVRSQARIGAGRAWGTNADHVHLYTARVGPWIADNVFEACGDDVMNLYTTARTITQRTSPTTLRLSSTDKYRPGDRLVFFNHRTGTASNATITEVDGEELSVTPAYSGALEETWVFNRDVANNDAVIRGNQFLGGRRYGVFLRVVRGLVSRNGFIEQSGPAIAIANDADWPSHEGLSSERVRILKNRFVGSAFDAESVGAADAMIQVYVEDGDSPQNVGPAQARLNLAIDILANEFVDVNRRAISLRNVSGATIAHNVFSTPEAARPTGPAYRVRIENSDGVTLRANQDRDARPLAPPVQVLSSQDVSPGF